MSLHHGTRHRAEVVDLLLEEADEECPVLELGDGYLAAILNPCLGPEEEHLMRLLTTAPDMLALLEDMATACALPQDFRNRANAIVSSVRVGDGRELDGAQELGSQGGYARD
ncbi:MAG TPA: hypothetical protein EYQ28_13315 [Henriciella sp.]|nr:hypothetical protein [Henriciella sp.]